MIEKQKRIEALNIKRTKLLTPYFNKSKYDTFLDDDVFQKFKAQIISINRNISNQIKQIKDE